MAEPENKEDGDKMENPPAGLETNEKFKHLSPPYEKAQTVYY